MTEEEEYRELKWLRSVHRHYNKRRLEELEKKFSKK